MHFGPSFYRTAAICSIISALTTLGLIFLPSFFLPVDNFDGRMNRINEPAYLLRSWIYLVHPFLAGTAALAVAMRLRTLASALAVVGLLGFLLWAGTEAGQQTMTLFAYDRWRAAWATADEITRAHIRTNAMMYQGLWDGMYFLLLIGFAIGNLCYGLVMVRRRGLTRVVGGFFLAAAALTAITNMLPELGGPTLPASIEPWLYPAIQPLGRTLIGVWLWRAADENGALPCEPG
jgi:hypothetical protein